MNKNLPIPQNEVARLDTLAQYNILDTLPEEEFDRLTQLASIICGVPIALITLIDKDRQWFKSKIGLETPETPRDISFCQYTINDESLFEIEDATKDDRFLSNPLVTDQPNIRFYAGYPLIDPDGFALGSLCVIDRKARKLTADQRRALTLLANEVVSQIVSRKKNAEKDKLEKMFNLSIDLKCAAGTDGYFKKLNPAFTLTLGWTIEELLAKPFYDFIHPDDVTTTSNEIKKLATGEKTINFENRFITKNGDYLPISWNAISDEITGELYAVGRDISERKKAEEKLTEYKHFFYNTANFSCIANVEGYFEVINSNFEKALGYSERELLESQFLSFVHPDDIDLTLKEIKKLQRGATTINFENRYRKKDGNYLWFDWHATPNPVTGKIYAIARDITEQKKAKELLTQSEEHNRFIMNSSPNSIVTINSSKKITFWNLQAETVFGWKKEEVLGKNMIDLLIPSRYRDTWNKVIDQNSKNGKNSYSNQLLELTLLHKAGNEFYGETSITPIVQDGIRYYSGFIQDITKRKEAEKKLSQSTKLLKTILANLRSGIRMEDQNRNLLFVNQHYCDMRNIDSKPEELAGTDGSNAPNEAPLFFKDAERLIIKTNKTLIDRKLVIGELLETLDNHFIERDYIPLFVDNEFKGQLWKYNDVTEKVQTQKLLEQSEERNLLIMNSSLNSIVTIDSAKKITFWNHQSEIVFGWKEEEVLGKVFTDFMVPTRNKELWDNSVYQYLSEGHTEFLNKQVELYGVNKAGNEFLTEITITPMTQDGETFFCAFIQDISDKKAAENIRKIQEEKFQNVITHMNLGLIEVDNNEIIQYANQSFAAIIGYEISELVGRNLIDFFDSQDNLDILTSKIKLRQQGVSDIYQIPIKNKSGELRWLTISGAPNYDNKGNVIGSIGIHLDITDQKKLESDLEKEKTNALKSSNAKEVFLANMSHEIRTPLNAIVGFLRELDKLELTGLQKDYINNCSIASKHLLSIINNILDISKIESGEMSLESVDFVFEKSISNVTTVLHPMLKQKELDFNITISKEIRNVLVGDAMRLQQILYNLVGNAIKFTSTGSISINCEVVDDSTFSQKLKISISDTGIGMESSFVSTIFNKFSQEDKETTRKYGGTGLGLPITKELVELMGGTIEIESEKNRGTTICLYLNYPKSSKENAVDLDIVKPVIRLKNISILLVEDNYLNRMVAQNSLQYYNCEVTEAENGLEAVEILKNKTFDIILMDIQMPIMGGIEAVLIIRNELNITTPIIALTANAFKTEIDKCKKAGMNDYVAKPFDEDILIETIAKYTVNKITSVAEPGFPETASIEKLYNLTTLQNLSRNNNEFVLKMIGFFVEQTIATIEKIDAALESNNFLEISQLIHKIRPSTDHMGVLSIQSEMKTLEKIAKETQNKGQITTIYILVKKTLQLVISQLQKNELNA